MATGGLERIERLFPRFEHVEVDSGRPDLVGRAEGYLGVVLPESYRAFLSRWGTLAADGVELYGLTQTEDVPGSGIPDVVWVTERVRYREKMPVGFVVFANDNGERYWCIDTSRTMEGNESPVVIWDATTHAVDRDTGLNFATFVGDYLEQMLEFEGR